MRLTVLGGSSPFTAGLFEELARVDRAGWPDEIILFGRDADGLAAVKAFASGRMPGVRVTASTSLPEALEGADLVIHQIRHGGLEGRADDEAYCQALGAPADETLGPGGLRAALRMRPGLEAVAAALAAAAPKALVINLANPLSLSTSWLHRNGVSRIIGICELPLVTGEALAALLGEPLEWEYAGFNHRGFLHSFTAAGRPVFEQLQTCLPFEGVGGVPRGAIQALAAVPTKYFRMFLGLAPVSSPGRAAELARLRDVVRKQLAETPDRLPTALAAREQPWWEKAVVPLVAACRSGGAIRQVLNTPDDDGLTRERMLRFEGGGMSLLPTHRPPPAVEAWIRSFEAHERACLDALELPTARSLYRAREADPLVS